MRGISLPLKFCDKHSALQMLCMKEQQQQLLVLALLFFDGQRKCMSLLRSFCIMRNTNAGSLFAVQRITIIVAMHDRGNSWSSYNNAKILCTFPFRPMRCEARENNFDTVGSFRTDRSIVASNHTIRQSFKFDQQTQYLELPSYYLLTAESRTVTSTTRSDILKTCHRNGGPGKPVRADEDEVRIVVVRRFASTGGIMATASLVTNANILTRRRRIHQINCNRGLAARTRIGKMIHYASSSYWQV